MLKTARAKELDFPNLISFASQVIWLIKGVHLLKTAARQTNGGDYGTPFKNGCPSDKWWRLLKKRHNDISLKTPESTAAIRHEMMTEERVKPYFQSLKSELDENELGQCYMEYGRDIHNIGNWRRKNCCKVKKHMERDV